VSKDPTANRFAFFNGPQRLCLVPFGMHNRIHSVLCGMHDRNICSLVGSQAQDPHSYRWRCHAAAGAALRTKIFQIGMDGLCSPQAIYNGLTRSGGTGGTYAALASITTTVSFSGAAAGCPGFGPSPSPHLGNRTAVVAECWLGAPSAMYVALDSMCQIGGATFSQVCGFACLPALSVCSLISLLE
jgi:hypothetical protein